MNTNKAANRIAELSDADKARFLAMFDKNGPTQPHMQTPCWVWLGAKSGGGYGNFKIRCKSFRAHRVAFRIATGPIPAGLDVLHRCDNPPCCNPEHLWLGTDVDNSADKESKNRGNHARGEFHGSCTHPERRACGEKQHLAKLTAEKVIAMRSAHSAGGITYVDLGLRYGVSGENAQCVVTRKTWKHVA